MAKSQLARIVWPAGGLHRELPYRQQPPYTTPDALNVRPTDTLEGRLRGGSRPGLRLRYPDEIGGGDEVRFIQQLFQPSDTGFEIWEDEFDGVTLSGDWSTATWIGTAPDVMVNPPPVAFNAPVGAVRDLLTIDTTLPYEVKMWCVPFDAGSGLAWHGSYKLFARLDDTTPDWTVDGLQAELVQTGTTGNYTGTLKVNAASVTTTHTFTAGSTGGPVAAWLHMIITPTRVQVFWANTLVLDEAVTPAGGDRVGFGLECTVTGGAAMISKFQIKHFTAAAKSQEVLIASAGGEIWRNNAPDTAISQVVAAGVSTDKKLQVADRGSKCYIADWSADRVTGSDGAIAADGITLTAPSVSDWTDLSISTTTDVVVITDGLGAVTDGTYKIASINVGNIVLALTVGGAGACSYQVIKAPLVYDATDNSLAIWFATAGKGQVPSGNPLVARYRDRVVLAGDKRVPYAWFMPRQGDPLDFDLTADASDAQRAVIGTTAEAGELTGEPITALIPFRDDYLILGSRASLWVIRGDPVFLGQLDAISREVGILSAHSWTHGPEGELYFLGMGGMYVLPPNAAGTPQLVSGMIPEELQNIDPSENDISLRYDFKKDGVMIHNTAEAG